MHDSAAEPERSASGTLFPPLLVHERGVTLREWLQGGRSYAEVLGAVEALAVLLATLHSSGRVHGSLTPDAALYLLHSTRWRFADLSASGAIGALTFSRVTVAAGKGTSL